MDTKTLIERARIATAGAARDIENAPEDEQLGSLCLVLHKELGLEHSERDIETLHPALRERVEAGELDPQDPDLSPEHEVLHGVLMQAATGAMQSGAVSPDAFLAYGIILGRRMGMIEAAEAFDTSSIGRPWFEYPDTRDENA